MSNETPEIQINDDLDVFADEFFGREPAEQASPVDETPDLDEDVAPENSDTQEDTVDEETLEEEVPVEDKPKKSKFQTRIDELTGKAREAERREQALRDEFEAFKAKFNDVKPEPKPVTETVPTADEGPDPDDVLENGDSKYPLGEFDPQYIRDLTRFTLKQERETEAAAMKARTEQESVDAAEAALHASWNEKLVPAQERYPDFVDKGQELIDSFADLDQGYAKYLTQTLMSMEFGTDVLYYLASNPEEADRIIRSGATSATIGLGRIESRFADAEAEKQLARPKISQAPTPPDTMNKGSAPVRITVPDDTDDLDAFSKKFFGRRK